jgi:hypothetical protein
MPYSDFTIDSVKAQFGLRLIEDRDLYATAVPVEISALLRDTLAENVSLALSISTEKARSEMIIAPLLIEARRQVDRRVSLFSGIDFTVDPQQGLNGICDFMLCRSPEQLTIDAPVVAVVQAKNENMKAGIGQCLAEMIAARLFNERKGCGARDVYGVVTTGNNWKFLQLVENTAYADRAEYHIKEIESVVGIIKSMLQGADPIP